MGHVLRICAVLTLCCGSFLSTSAQEVFNRHSFPTSDANLLTADSNRDGYIDLLQYGGSPAVALNNTHGGFPSAHMVSAQPAVFAAIADFNGDGYPDIATCTSTGSDQSPAYAINIYLNNRTGVTFTRSHSTPIADQCVGIAVGDVDHNGHQDIVIGSTHFNGTTNIDKLTTYFGDGAGHISHTHLQIVAEPEPSHPDAACVLGSIAGADFEGNGGLSVLLFATCNFAEFTDGTIYYAAGNGNGAFNETLVAEDTYAPRGGPSHLVDINNDGLPDVILTGHQEFPFTTDSVVLTVTSLGNGNFSVGSVGPDQQANDVFSAALADFNGDGFPDFAIPYMEVDNSQFFLGFFNGPQFGETSSIAFPGSGTDAVAADFNNDNRPDFAVVSADPNTGALQLLVYTNAGHYSVSPCLPSGPGVHVCDPVSGHTYVSPVQFTATASGINGPVRLTQLYIDGTKIGNFPGNILNTTASVSVGMHTARVVELEYNGQFTKSPNVPFTVTAQCTAPTGAVKICTPTPGANVTSPVSVIAAATASPGTSISAMRLYVDNVSRFTVHSAHLSTSVALPAGRHLLAVVAYERNGHTLKSTETITVP